MLVQKGDVDAKQAVSFIKKCPQNKFLLFYSSLLDDGLFASLQKYLSENVGIPFLGTKTTCFVTKKEGYCEDSVVYMVFCGDFEVSVFHEKIDYVSPEKTAVNMVNQIGLLKPDLCLVYSSNYYKDNNAMDAVLRRICDKFPQTQFSGGVSSPKPFIALNEGTFEDTLALAMITGLTARVGLDTGFVYDKSSGKELKVTESDELRIYGLNDKNAASEYSKTQHIMPYLLNTLSNMLMRPGNERTVKRLADTNPHIYSGLLRFCIEGFGNILCEGIAEPMPVLHIDEKKGYITPNNHVVEGTVLKKVITSREDQLEVYDRIAKRFPDASFILMCSCAYGLLWAEFDYEGFAQRLKNYKSDAVLSFTYGEFSTYTRERKLNNNVAHGATVASLFIK